MDKRDGYAVVKKQHLNALKTTLDGYLLPHGFTRTPSGTNYRRMQGDNSQSIDAFFRVPRWYRYSDVYSAVTAHCRISIKDVNSTALRIAGSEGRLPFDKDTTIFQPVGLLSDERNYNEWEVYSREEYVAIADEFGIFLESYVLPFLDSYWNAADIVDHSESDPGLLKVEGWPLILAASHYLVGNYVECVRIINERLGMNPGGRSRYSGALAFAADLESEQARFSVL